MGARPSSSSPSTMLDPTSIVVGLSQCKVSMQRPSPSSSAGKTKRHQLPSVTKAMLNLRDGTVRQDG
eukprot:scaffold254434_cov28-Prasinocladus_malaysianus.AAC.1